MSTTKHIGSGLTNHQWRRGVLLDVAGYSFESAFRIALGAAVGIFVARYLGPEGYGLLSYAGSVFVLLAPLTMLGMRPILLREFATKDDWKVVLVSALSRQVPVAIASSILGFVLIAATRGLDDGVGLIALAMLPQPLLAIYDTIRVNLEARGRVRWIVTTGLVATGLSSLLKILAIAAGASIWVFALASTLEMAFLAVGLTAGLGRLQFPRSPLQHFDADRGRELIAESWPLLLSGLAVVIYMRADIFMLGLLSGDAETGIYVAASRLSEVWYFLPVAAAAAIRPRLARMYVDSQDNDYHTTTQQFLTLAFAVSVVAVIAILFVADRLVVALYGTDFQAAAEVLRIHIFAAPFVFLSVAAGQWFIDRKLTKIMMARSIVGAVVNIALNLLLIPAYGATGAAVATLIAYAIAGVFFNAALAETRTAFWMQVRAFALRWK